MNLGPFFFSSDTFWNLLMILRFSYDLDVSLVFCLFSGCVSLAMIPNHEIELIKRTFKISLAIDIAPKLPQLFSVENMSDKVHLEPCV